MRFVNRLDLPSLLLAAATLMVAILPTSAGAEVRSAPLAPAPAQLTKASTVAPEPPARVAAGFAVEPLASLVEAEKGAAEQVEALAAWNRAGRVPLQDGIVRPLALPREVRFGGEMASAPAGLHAGGAFVRLGADATIWGASVEVAEAYRLRLHLEGVDLPAGTRLWVYGDDGETVAFGPELARDGSLWTPSVGGPTIHLEVELPRSASGAKTGFRVDRVLQLFPLDADGAPVLGALAPKVGECLIDVSCVSPAKFPVVDQASKAVAQLEFVSGFSSFLCTGGLLNLADGAPVGLAPPFLTANHCISTQSEAATLEAFWDFRSSTCDGAVPSRGSLPRTNGSSLLVTSAETDFTLLGLALPSGRVLLGWDATVPVQPKDTILHRLSHPVPGFSILAQRYTRYRVKGEQEKISCDLGAGDPPANDLTKFHHTVFLEGGTFGGSSGAPLMTGQGQVVGQLLGACGPNTEDGCSMANDELDGNFYSSYDTAAPFLGAGPPEDGWHTTPEVPGFELQVVITGTQAVEGQPEGDCIVETFCASGALAGRPEVFVKVIGPRPNGFLWVQISRFTPSKVEVWVRQTSSGVVRYYVLDAVGSQADDVPGLQDRMAFSP
jgi:hypothetical protein